MRNDKLLDTAVKSTGLGEGCKMEKGSGGSESVWLQRTEYKAAFMCSFLTACWSLTLSGTCVIMSLSPDQNESHIDPIDYRKGINL